MQLRDASLLIVDDEPYYREIATEWFKREGCRVLAAQDGEEALRLLEGNRVNAIVTDIRMPRLDGIDLMKRLKAQGAYTPAAVAITGFSDLSQRDAYDLGIESQLSKPVSRKVLISAVQKALMDREELWALPFHDGITEEVSANFESLQAALDRKQIAFGHGGFCLNSAIKLPEESTLEFGLTFEADQQVLLGQGILRWVSEKERKIGVEIDRVDERGRSWLAKLTTENRTVSFIPRTT